MKDYIRQIIRIFTNSSLDKTTREEVHQWLVSPEHADEKEAALHELWIETEGRPSKNMHESLKAVYRKAGFSKKTTLLPEVHALCSSRNTLGSVRICHLLSDQSRILRDSYGRKLHPCR